MTFQQLEYVIAVAEEKSFSKAAKKLYIAQPSLSQYIINIENQIGVQLFDRSTSPVRLTYGGERFVEKAKEILELKCQLYDDMANINNLKSGNLKLGITAFRNCYFMPSLLTEFQNKFPNIKLQLVEAPRLYLESECAKGNIDVFITTTPINETLFSYEVIMQENVVLAVPENYEINDVLKEQNKENRGKFLKANLSQFKDEPFILLKPEQNLHRLAMKLCRRAGFKPNIKLENGTVDSALSMVLGGIGITFVSDTVAEHGTMNRGIVYYDIQDQEACRNVVIAYKKNRYLSNAATAFIKALREHVD